MRLVAAAATLVVLAAGCGSGSREAAKPAKPASFAARVEGACLQRNSELHQLPRPRNQADLAGYVVSMLNIVRYYRGQLAALHPSGGRGDFARYRRLVRADEATATSLLEAAYRRNHKAVVRLLALQRDRSAREQALLKRLGVDC